MDPALPHRRRGDRQQVDSRRTNFEKRPVRQRHQPSASHGSVHCQAGWYVITASHGSLHLTCGGCSTPTRTATVATEPSPGVYVTVTGKNAGVSVPTKTRTPPGASGISVF